MTFKLLTHAAENNDYRSGMLIGDSEVFDIETALKKQNIKLDETNPVSVLSLLESWDQAYPALSEISDNAGKVASARIGALTEIRLAAPIRYPGNIYCAAANYMDHMKEMSAGSLPDKSRTKPFFFIKLSRQTVIGTGDEIRVPHSDAKVDWEAELAVVIGQRCKNVASADAMNYVAGFTIMNDISDRYRNRREDWPFAFDWFGGKSFDTSAPMGPWIVPAGSLPQYNKLAIQLWVNDELMQDSSSDQMFFTVSEQIEYLSNMITLLPGDVIATGTPAGVGHPRGRYLQPGDRIKTTIEGIGTIENPVVAGY